MEGQPDRAVGLESQNSVFFHEIGPYFYVSSEQQGVTAGSQL
jgi:hypothetical protein